MDPVCLTLNVKLTVSGRSREPFTHVFTILIIIEHPLTLYPSDHAMMQEAGSA